MASSDATRARGYLNQNYDWAIRNLFKLGGEPAEIMTEGARSLFEIEDVIRPMQQQSIEDTYANAQNRQAGMLHASINARLGRDIDMSWADPNILNADLSRLNEIKLPTYSLEKGYAQPYELGGTTGTVLQTPSRTAYEQAVIDRDYPGEFFTADDWFNIEAEYGPDEADRRYDEAIATFKKSIEAVNKYEEKTDEERAQEL